MKKILLFVALIAVGITATTRSTSGTQGDKPLPQTAASANNAKLVSTYYPSKWRGVAIDPADADFMYAYTYLVNYASSTATLMSGPTYAMFALTSSCRSEWLSSKIDPSCTSGCRTWSYYYSPAPTFTSSVNYLAVGCPGVIDLQQ